MNETMKTKMEIVVDSVRSLLLFVFAIYGLSIKQEDGINAVSFLLSTGFLFVGAWYIVQSILYFIKKTVVLWYIPALFGVFSILFGLYFIYYPLETYGIISIYFGSFLIILSIIELTAIKSKTKMQFSIYLGSIIIGIIAIIYSSVFMKTFYYVALILIAGLAFVGFYEVYLDNKKLKKLEHLDVE